MPDTALEQALDQLYGADPDAFIGLRKELITELRAAGDRAGANVLKAARRPNTSAWALNQLARREPQLVVDLLERSNELRVAQSRPGSAPVESMQETIRAHRQALTEATDAALAVLGPKANDAFRSEIISSLRAASTDPDVGRQLEIGRLVREADGASGFPDAGHLTLVPDAPEPAPPTAPSRPAPRARPAERPDPREVAAEAERTRRAAELEAEHRADVAARDDAHERAAAASADAEHAAATVARLESELDQARRDAREARDRSRNAKAEAKRLDAKARGTRN